MVVNKLIRKHKHKIVPFERSFEELVEYLEAKLDVKRINLEEVSQTYVAAMTRNVVFGGIHGKNIRHEDVNFYAFEVIKNHKSDEYFKDEQVYYMTAEKKIIVLIEKNTKCVATNSNKLQLELLWACGISQYDYDNDTLALIAYLALYEFEKAISPKIKRHVNSRND